MAANIRPAERDLDVALIGDRLTARVVDLLNVGYEIPLQIFERFFAHTEETDAQLTTLADATIRLMVAVIKPLGDLITTLPGLPALTRMTRLLYEKHVPADPVLALVFADMPPDQPERLAAWLAEAFGGPARPRDTGRASDLRQPPGRQPGSRCSSAGRRPGRGPDQPSALRWRPERQRGPRPGTGWLGQSYGGSILAGRSADKARPAPGRAGTVAGSEELCRR